MVENTLFTPATLAKSLADLELQVADKPFQPLNQFAENMVMLWLRVLEEKDMVPPRLTAEGTLPRAFHLRVETRISKRLDPVPPFSEPAGYRMEREARLGKLGTTVAEYFSRSGYRSSSDHCDSLMVELEGFSRFFANCCLDAERQAGPATMVAMADGAPSPSASPGRENPAENLLRLVRRDFAIWEPRLNECIVTWEQNALNDFEQALRKLEALLALSDGGRDAHRVRPGYPLRAAGLARLNVTEVEPVLRPLRSQSMFTIRHSRLIRRLEELQELPAAMIRDLQADVVHFSRMIEQNFFMLAGPPGFWGSHRAGVPLIRGRPNAHPFLLDLTDFFKKAVLFHNGTYTAAGGGIDWMFLRVKQLERYFKFQIPGGAHEIRRLIDACLLGWQENRLAVFTKGLLALAEFMRKDFSSSAP
ncbi:MAG: hypothetical protein V3S29_06505 [bacterium]